MPPRAHRHCRSSIEKPNRRHDECHEYHQRDERRPRAENPLALLINNGAIFEKKIEHEKKMFEVSPSGVVLAAEHERLKAALRALNFLEQRLPSDPAFVPRFFICGLGVRFFTGAHETVARAFISHRLVAFVHLLH